MPVEKSAGAIIFTKKEGKKHYLLLHYPKGARTSKDYWDLPKGHVEKGETEIETMKREVKEETGLKNIVILDGYKETIKYFFTIKNKNILKFVTFFLVESKTDKVKISREHEGFIWLCYKEAIEKLNFKNARNVLEKADKFIKEKELD